MFLLARNWWSLLVRGLLGIAVGVLTFIWPGITLSALIVIFGVYAFIDGIVNLVGAWRHSQHHERWGASLLEGIAGVLAGIFTFLWPAVTVVVLVIIIAGWAIITGVFEIGAAFRMRRHIAGEWMLGLLGVASIVFGIAIFLAPLTGALVISLWFGAYAFVFGVMMTVLAFRLRNWGKGISANSSQTLAAQ